MQQDFFQSSEPSASDSDNLRSHLAFHKTFRTRAQICESLGWTERQLRDAAEGLGSDVVRCQAGFKLTELLTREEVPLAMQAGDSFISQAKRMIRYGVALRRRLHSMVG